MRRTPIAPPTKLVQACNESSNFCILDCPSITHGGFLTARGFPTGYFYTAHRQILTVYRYDDSLASTTELFKHGFGIGEMITSVAYYRLNEKSDEAVLVLVQQVATAATPSITYVYCISMETKKPIKKYVLRGSYTHLEVCIDGSELAELDQMKESLKSMPNVIVVGGEDSAALMISLGSIHNHTHEVKPEAPFRKVYLLRPEENGMMEYRCDNGSMYFDPTTARVQSLCYMSQRGFIAVGLSNGVVYFISLKTGVSDSVYLGNGPVNQLAVQHPLNDTDNVLFLWAHVRYREISQLFLLSTVPNNNDRKTELRFVPRLAYAPPGCVDFLQLRTVVLSRQQAIGLGNADEVNNEESMRSFNNSFAVKEAGRFNQLMLFLYTERVDEALFLKGCVFDLDGYYSRRMPREVLSDRTLARQCGFLSHFRAFDLSFNPVETLDFMLSDVGRFVPAASLETIDQHFYPSAFHFTFHLLSDQRIVEMNVPCLQGQTVDEISRNFIGYYNNPPEAVRFLYGVGLCNSLPDENISVMRTCLFRVLLHNYFPDCMSFLNNEAADMEMLNFAHKWLSKEVGITKSQFDEKSKALFTTKFENLPKSAISFVEHSRSVFRRATQLYDVLITRFQHVGVSEDVMQRLKLNKKVCEDLLLQTSAILFGSYIDLLRDTPENVERLNKVRIGFGGRQTTASRSKVQLEIYKIFEDIIEASYGIEHYNGLFGNKSPYELYPPDNFVDLLDVLPHFRVTLSAKLQIFGYFCKDLDLFAPIEGQEKSTFDTACEFLLNDKLNKELVDEAMSAWNSDMNIQLSDELPSQVKADHSLTSKGFEDVTQNDLFGENNIHTPVVKQTNNRSLFHSDQFDDSLVTLTPSVQRPTSNLLKTPTNKQATTNIVPPSPYIHQEVSKIVRNSAIKSKDLELFHQLTTPQSVRVNQEKRKLSSRANITSRKRQFGAEDGMHTPPSDMTKLKTPTSILRSNKNKSVRTVEKSIKFVEEKRVHIIPSNHENRELRQAESSFTDFARLDESSVDDSIIFNNSIGNVEMREQDNEDEPIVLREVYSVQDVEMEEQFNMTLNEDDVEPIVLREVEEQSYQVVDSVQDVEMEEEFGEPSFGEIILTPKTVEDVGKQQSDDMGEVEIIEVDEEADKSAPKSEVVVEVGKQQSDITNESVEVIEVDKQTEKSDHDEFAPKSKVVADKPDQPVKSIEILGKSPKSKVVTEQAKPILDQPVTPTRRVSARKSVIGKTPESNVAVVGVSKQQSDDSNKSVEIIDKSPKSKVVVKEADEKSSKSARKSVLGKVPESKVVSELLDDEPKKPASSPSKRLRRDTFSKLEDVFELSNDESTKSTSSPSKKKTSESKVVVEEAPDNSPKPTRRASSRKSVIDKTSKSKVVVEEDHGKSPKSTRKSVIDKTPKSKAAVEEADEKSARKSVLGKSSQKKVSVSKAVDKDESEQLSKSTSNSSKKKVSVSKAVDKVKPVKSTAQEKEDETPEPEEAWVRLNLRATPDRIRRRTARMSKGMNK